MSRSWSRSFGSARLSTTIARGMSRSPVDRAWRRCRKSRLTTPHGSCKASGQVSLLNFGDRQTADLFQHHRVELLLFVRDAWGEGDDVPMHMSVPLLAAEAHHVEPFRGQRRVSALPTR